MAESHDSITRPAPPTTPTDRVAAWFAWFGVARLVAVSIAVVAVVGGSWWLIRTPAPPPEAALPMAVATPVTTSAPSVIASEADRSSTETDPVVVHVAGMVASPGVHEVHGGARVHEAIAAAGGATPGADVDRLNLAATVTDGQRIYVPAHGESVPPDVAAPDGVVEMTGPIDVNRATASELETLPGVGPATAAAIVDDRERNGPFATIDDLERVAGIGPNKLGALRDLVTV